MNKHDIAAAHPISDGRVLGRGTFEADETVDPQTGRDQRRRDQRAAETLMNRGGRARNAADEP